MNKTFFLPKGLDKFSELNLTDLENVKGGLATEPVGNTYIPTGGGRRRCLDGYVWSDTFRDCVKVVAVRTDSERAVSAG